MLYFTSIQSDQHNDTPEIFETTHALQAIKNNFHGNLFWKIKESASDISDHRSC